MSKAESALPRSTWRSNGRGRQARAALHRSTASSSGKGGGQARPSRPRGASLARPGPAFVSSANSVAIRTRPPTSLWSPPRCRNGNSRRDPRLDAPLSRDNCPSPVAQVRAPSVYNPVLRAHPASMPFACRSRSPSRTLRRSCARCSRRPMFRRRPSWCRTSARRLPRSTTAAWPCESQAAYNVVVRRPDGSLYGDLFDGEGFVRGLRRWGYDPTGTSCLVVGSGGVGAAIAAALAEARVRTIALHDVSARVRPRTRRAFAAPLSRGRSQAGLAGPAGLPDGRQRYAARHAAGRPVADRCRGDWPRRPSWPMPS